MKTPLLSTRVPRFGVVTGAARGMARATGGLTFWLFALAATGSAGAAPAPGEAPDVPRFAVVDVSSSPAPGVLIDEIERQMVRLRPASQPIADHEMRRLLGRGEGAVETAARLLGDARGLRAAGDCAAAEQRAREAEALVLPVATPDEQRPLLTDVYAIRVRCAHERGDEAALTAAAPRLRALVATPPNEFPTELWDTRIAGAVPRPGTVELFVDSEPANAQVSVNFRSEGVTPRGLKVMPGEYEIEVYKEGYRKAYRHLTVREGAPARAVFRLVERAHDRLDQVAGALRSIRKEGAVVQPSTLSRIAQLARVESLVVVTAAAPKVAMAFFDAERGALASERISSTFDATTGRVEALSSRADPPPAAAGGGPAVPGILAPLRGGGRARRPGENLALEAQPTAPGSAVPEADVNSLAMAPTRPKPYSPWWGWLIAGALIAVIGAAVYADQPNTRNNLDVRAHWDGPPDGR